MAGGSGGIQPDVLQPLQIAVHAGPEVFPPSRQLFLPERIAEAEHEVGLHVAAQRVEQQTGTALDMVCNTNTITSMATASTTLQVRLPRVLRDGAASALEEMGLDLPTAVRLYLTKVAKTRRIPFALEAEPAAEAIPVDRATQTRMDRIAKAWKTTKRQK